MRIDTYLRIKKEIYHGTSINRNRYSRSLVKENPYNAKNFISNTKAIIQHFRDQNIEVIFIRHSEDEGLLATGSDNWQVYHELKPQENEKIFNKYYNSIFKDTELKEYLNRKKYYRFNIRRNAGGILH